MMKRLANGIAVVGLMALFAVTVLTMLEILIRSEVIFELRDHFPAFDEFIFWLGLDGLSDLYAPLGIIAVAACFPAMAVKRGAIRVKFLVEQLPWRLRELLSQVGDTVLLVMMALMTFWLGEFTLDVWASGETTWLLSLPRWPAWLIALISLSIATLIQLSLCVMQVKRLFAKEAPASIEDEEIWSD